jgi:hypothetical protein
MAEQSKKMAAELCVYIFGGPSVFQSTFVAFTMTDIWWHVGCLNMAYLLEAYARMRPAGVFIQFSFIAATAYA